MFEYVIPNPTALSPDAQARYRTGYCGLCRRIHALHRLRELLQSLHQKKRYHRLRDGSLLRLDDSLEGRCV